MPFTVHFLTYMEAATASSVIWLLLDNLLIHHYSYYNIYYILKAY